MEKFINWLTTEKPEPIETELKTLNLEIKNAKFTINGHNLEPGNFLQNATIQNFINSQKKAEKKSFSFKERAEEIKRKYNYKFYKLFNI